MTHTSVYALTLVTMVTIIKAMTWIDEALGLKSENFLLVYDVLGVSLDKYVSEAFLLAAVR